MFLITSLYNLNYRHLLKTIWISQTIHHCYKVASGPKTAKHKSPPLSRAQPTFRTSPHQTLLTGHWDLMRALRHPLLMGVSGCFLTHSEHQTAAEAAGKPPKGQLAQANWKEAVNYQNRWPAPPIFIQPLLCCISQDDESLAQVHEKGERERSMLNTHRCLPQGIWIEVTSFSVHTTMFSWSDRLGRHVRHYPGPLLSPICSTLSWTVHLPPWALGYMLWKDTSW